MLKPARRRRRGSTPCLLVNVLTVVVTISLAACAGSGATSPPGETITSASNLSGTWSNPQNQPLLGEAVTLTISASADSLLGSWSFADGATGIGPDPKQVRGALIAQDSVVLYYLHDGTPGATFRGRAFSADILVGTETATLSFITHRRTIVHAMLDGGQSRDDLVE